MLDPLVTAHLLLGHLDRLSQGLFSRLHIRIATLSLSYPTKKCGQLVASLGRLFIA